jgi:hypothetical protein
VGLQAPKPRPWRLSRAQGAWVSHTRATMTIARKLARGCFHGLRELGAAALEPPPEPLHRPRRSLPPAHQSQITPELPPAPRSAATRAHQRRSQKDQAAGVDPRGSTDRPSRSPAARPRTQTSPGARGTTAPTTSANPHNHSPPTLTTGPVQIASTVGVRVCCSSRMSQKPSRKPEARLRRYTSGAAVHDASGWTPPRCRPADRFRPDPYKRSSGLARGCPDSLRRRQRWAPEPRGLSQPRGAVGQVASGTALPGRELRRRV